MHVRKVIPFLLVSSYATALEVQPWFGDVYEFQFLSSYTFSHFRHVQNEVRPFKSAFNDHLFTFDLGVTATDYLFAEAELEIVDTPIQSWGYRSAAGQIRWLGLNDVEGDPISLCLSAAFRGVSRKSLKDVSCPYHSRLNASVNISIGKEWSECSFWKLRVFGLAGLGLGSTGLPWIDAQFYVRANQNNRHQEEVFAIGYFGLGGRSRVNIQDFHGWGPYRHASIDLGFGYRYLFDVWGQIRASVGYRVYAHSFPENLFFVMVAYYLPFSWF